MKIATFLVFTFLQVFAHGQYVRDLIIYESHDQSSFVVDQQFTFATRTQIRLNNAPLIPPETILSITHPFRVGLYLTTDDQINESSLLLTSYIVPDLEILHERFIQFDLFSLPSFEQVTDGTYFLGIYVDDEEVVDLEYQPNNKYVIRRADGELDSIHFKRLSIEGPSLLSQIHINYGQYSIDLLSKTEKPFTTQVYTTSGKLVFEDFALETHIPKHLGSGIFILRLLSLTGVYVERIHL